MSFSITYKSKLKKKILNSNTKYKNTKFKKKMGCCNTADATEPQPDNDAVTEALRKKSKLKEPSLLRSEMNASHAQTQMREKEVFAPQVSEQELV
jgi:hypothetical protein